MRNAIHTSIPGLSNYVLPNYRRETCWMDPENEGEESYYLIHAIRSSKQQQQQQQSYTTGKQAISSLMSNQPSEHICSKYAIYVQQTFCGAQTNINSAHKHLRQFFRLVAWHACMTNSSSSSREKSQERPTLPFGFFFFLFPFFVSLQVGIYCTYMYCSSTVYIISIATNILLRALL